MSNIEHLIENAIVAMEEKHDYDWWISTWQTKAMIKEVKSPPDEIWQMAQYVYYTYRQSLIWDLTDEIEKKYGYPVPE